MNHDRITAMETPESNIPLPAAACVGVSPDGEHHLAGKKCRECGATYTDKRQHCAGCGGRDSLDDVALSHSGKLYSFSIVHRSYPGVDVPFVSAVVDLEGGGSLKGTLRGIEPSPDHVTFDMPVKVVFGDALGRRDQAGNRYVSYFFEPA